jgi:hypothetical protein
MRRPTACLLPLLLAGCMTTSPGSYDALTRTSHFALSQDAMIANKVSSGLAAGRYEAVFQTAQHVYYLGPPKALIMPNGTRVNGGIALPRAAAGTNCHLFIQIGDDSQAVRDMRMGLVVSQLAKLEAGRIREFQDDPACAPFLDVVRVTED